MKTYEYLHQQRCQQQQKLEMVAIPLVRIYKTPLVESTNGPNIMKPLKVIFVLMKLVNTDRTKYKGLRV